MIRKLNVFVFEMSRSGGSVVGEDDVRFERLLVLTMHGQRHSNSFGLRNYLQET